MTSEQDRVQLEERSRRLLADARTRMMSGRKAGHGTTTDASLVFFSFLAMRLAVRPTWEIPTMATDGRSLFYNPAFTCGLTTEEVVGVVSHEVLHCGLLHFARMSGRKHDKWNVAADLALNPLIEGAGHKLPKCRLMPGEGSFASLPKGLSAEEYYALLPEDLSSAAGGLIGDVQPAGDGGEEGGGAGSAALEASWRVAVTAAAEMAKARGTLPGDLDRMVGAALDPPLPWRQVLRDFVARTSKSDFSWAKANRRFVASGLYLPGMHSEELGDVVVAVDTSGSIGGDVLAAFENELNGILDSYPCRVHVLYCDAAVLAVETFTSDDRPVKLTPRGGGGTDHDPVFRRVEEERWEPACMVCLTDGYTSVTVPEPAFPTLWCLTESGSHAGLPFGRTVYMGG